MATISLENGQKHQSEDGDGSMVVRRIGEIVTGALQEVMDDGGPKDFQYSFEYFPPKTTRGVENLYLRWLDMARQEAKFADITWGAGGTTSTTTMQMSKDALRKFRFEVNMHLTCTNIRAEEVHRALEEAKEGGIRNICALRGDAPAGQEAWEPVEGGFACGKDLIEFIRKKYGDYFGISCSGYPEGHPQAMTQVPEDYEFSVEELGRRCRIDDAWWVCKDEDFKKELQYLKEKVEAGAEVIITQLFYSAEVFQTFVDRCREIGIQVPILPGIMPLNTLGGFKRMTGFCKTHIPAELQEIVDRFSETGDDAGFRAAGEEYMIQLCKDLVAAGHRFLHFYAMNLATPVYNLIEALGGKINKDLEFSEEEKEEVKQMAQAVGKLLPPPPGKQ